MVWVVLQPDLCVITDAGTMYSLCTHTLPFHDDDDGDVEAAREQIETNERTGDGGGRQPGVLLMGFV